jgi:ABC-2 type transport system permease protein
MRLWAEERKSGTIELLLTLPITTWQAVLGKFKAGWLFLVLAISLSFPLILTVMFLGQPDLKVIFLSYAGAFLLSGQMLAVGIFFSALTRNQVTSFILSTVALLVLLLLDSPAIMDITDNFLPSFFQALLAHAGFVTHFENWSRGVLRLSDICFFFGQTFFWLWATAKLLDLKRA